MHASPHLFCAKPYDMIPGSGLPPEPAPVPPVPPPRAAQDRPGARQQVRIAPHASMVSNSLAFFPTPFVIFALLLRLPPFLNSDQPLLGRIAGAPTASPPRRCMPAFVSCMPAFVSCMPAFVSREEFSTFFPRRLSSSCTYTTLCMGAHCCQLFARETRQIFVVSFVCCIYSSTKMIIQAFLYLKYE